MSYESFHHSLFLSFWHIELSNLPVGVLEHRRLAPEEAKALIGAARQHNSLLCLSTADLLAPYQKHEMARYEELCAVLDRSFGIPLDIDDFFSKTVHEGNSFHMTNPLNCVQVSEGNPLLVVTCSYSMADDTAEDEHMGFVVCPDSVEFCLFSAQPVA
jgi:hypothetical protein